MTSPHSISAPAVSVPPTAGALMAAEIAEQPAVLARGLDAADRVAAVAAQIRAFSPRFVLIAARGTSDHAGLYAKYLAEVEMGLPAGLASASAFTVYGSTPNMTGVLMIAVSQSGASPDLIATVAAARAGGALTVAVTNAPDSPLAAAAELSVAVHAGPELAVAATKTYTAELLALHLLLAGPGAAQRAAGLPDAAAATLALCDQAGLEEIADRIAGLDRFVLTARGYSYATAREAALKLMETSYVSAHAFSGADLLHGPLAMVDASVPVIAVVSPGRGGEAMAPVLERLAATGAELLRVGTANASAGDPELPIAPAGLAEPLWPMLEILPLQRLAWHLARRRGQDPDRPRGLAKVTETR